MASAKKKPHPINRPKPLTPPITLQLGEKLYERAFAYSEKTGIKVTAALRTGLDKLLKENNF